MAKLWENTLVTALRDAQWFSKAPQALFPPFFIKLDGNPESALGDALLDADGGRYFLIEVKATRDQITEEWVKRGRFRPKRAYAKLQRAIDDVIDQQAPDDECDLLKDHLWQSMRCHQFAYWGDPIRDEPASAHPSFEAIRIEPYLRAIMTLRSAHAPTAHQTVLPYQAAALATLMGESVARVYPDLPFAALQDAIGYAVYLASSMPMQVEKLDPLGLSFDEFQDYINFLTEDARDGDEEIHAVVAAPDRGLIRVVSRTSELRAIVNPVRGPAASPARRPRSTAPTVPFAVTLEQATQLSARDTKPGGSAP